MMNKKIALIGAGNIATHLGIALLKEGFNICQIYSRSIESARALGMKTGITYTSELTAVYPDCDIYIFSVSDDAILPVFKSLRINKDAIIIHTSGSTSIDIFKPYTSNCGVLYPLQTFSKKREINFKDIPLFIEFSNDTVKKTLYEIANKLSNIVEEITSEKRLMLHISAVFACNFTNYLYGVGGSLVQKAGFDFSVLRPLIMETAEKVQFINPQEAQTGPAKRKDETILNKHKNILKPDKKLYSIYTLLSDAIEQDVTDENKEKETPDNQMSLW